MWRIIAIKQRTLIQYVLSHFWSLPVFSSYSTPLPKFSSQKQKKTWNKNRISNSKLLCANAIFNRKNTAYRKHYHKHRFLVLFFFSIELHFISHLSGVSWNFFMDITYNQIQTSKPPSNEQTNLSMTTITKVKRIVYKKLWSQQCDCRLPPKRKCTKRKSSYLNCHLAI